MQAKSRPGPAAPTEYSPEIEARRSDYEGLAEALVHITRLESERPDYGPDVKESPLDGSDDWAIINGVEAHLRALCDAIDWYDPRTLRKSYAELRLWNDELELERHRDYQEAWAETDKGKQAAA